MIVRVRYFAPYMATEVPDNNTPQQIYGEIVEMLPSGYLIETHGGIRQWFPQKCILTTEVLDERTGEYEELSVADQLATASRAGALF